FEGATRVAHVLIGYAAVRFLTLPESLPRFVRILVKELACELAVGGLNLRAIETFKAPFFIHVEQVNGPFSDAGLPQKFVAHDICHTFFLLEINAELLGGRGSGATATVIHVAASAAFVDERAGIAPVAHPSSRDLTVEFKRSHVVADLDGDVNFLDRCGRVFSCAPDLLDVHPDIGFDRRTRACWKRDVELTEHLLYRVHNR